MANRVKKICHLRSQSEKLEGLVILAQGVGLPDGAFDGEVEDACFADYAQAKQAMREATLLEQLAFLVEHGYEVGRLADLIREMSGKER